jgi:hypothetical protein
MNNIFKAGVYFGVVCLAACSKPPWVSLVSPEQTYTIHHSLFPTPVDHASERYSDFRYELRKLGESEFKSYPPATVKPTSRSTAALDRGRSIEVHFDIPIPEPKHDEVFEYRDFYRLDGVLQQDEWRQTVFVGHVR